MKKRGFDKYTFVLIAALVIFIMFIFFTSLIFMNYFITGGIIKAPSLSANNNVQTNVDNTQQIIEDERIKQIANNEISLYLNEFEQEMNQKIDDSKLYCSALVINHTRLYHSQNPQNLQSKGKLDCQVINVQNNPDSVKNICTKVNMTCVGGVRQTSISVYSGSQCTGSITSYEDAAEFVNCDSVIGSSESCTNIGSGWRKVFNSVPDKAICCRVI